MEIAANIILGLLGITFVYGFYCIQSKPDNEMYESDY